MDRPNRCHAHVRGADANKISCRLSSVPKLLLIASIVIMSNACAVNQRTALPPIPSDPMAERVNGEFVWIDLMTEDIAAATSFFSQLFGWRAARSGQNRDYYLFYLHGKPIAGMVETDNQNPSESESLWMLSMSVQGLDRALAIVNDQRGEVLDGPMDIEGRGRMALIRDSNGAPLILLDGHRGGPNARKVESGNWIWTDLFTGNRQQAMAFYGSLVGFRAEWIEVGKTHSYDLFKRDDRTIAGIVELDWEGLQDNWLPYFMVEDVGRAIERARMLGGHLILESGDVAVLADPTGAAFGIQMQ